MDKNIHSFFGKLTLVGRDFPHDIYFSRDPLKDKGDSKMVMKYVYFFGAGRADGKGTMKDLLGGKGAGLAEMTNAGVPVPPGFTITTDVCRYYYATKQKLPKELEAQEKAAMEKLQKIMGKRFGNAENPLLVSVRSGAKFSMPGMMDTI